MINAGLAFFVGSLRVASMLMGPRFFHIYAVWKADEPFWGSER